MQKFANHNRLIIVLDGMGTDVIKRVLDKNGFFASHLTGIETAIIPATTVAATTAYRTGKMPWETGFVGWSQYYSEVNEVIEVFTNLNYYTGLTSKMSQHTNTLPCKTIVETLVDNGHKAFEILPSWAPNGFDTFEQWLNQIVITCNRETNAYIYAYWNEPDTTLHDFGTNSDEVKILLHDMEQKIEQACNKIKNTTKILVTADHGHTYQQPLYLEDFPYIEQCLSVPVSLESRCVSFFVKPERIKDFPLLFNKHFGKWFKLVTKQEFETNYLYANKPVRFVGNYVALAIDKYGIYQNRSIQAHISTHAGITKAEMEIPVIEINI
ncbi:MAG: alkaline phosphatase family protein [Alphaproteobacteria bacterium]|nr:alkaline phosphatase family protein [Alphaproteobacteria bacterium]